MLVRHRLGDTVVEVLTDTGVVLARHRRAAAGAGAVVCSPEHVAAREKVVPANFADRPPCRRPPRCHPRWRHWRGPPHPRCHRRRRGRAGGRRLRPLRGGPDRCGQPTTAGSCDEPPNGEAALYQRLRARLDFLKLPASAEALPGILDARMFGTKQTTDPVHRLIGSASAWGGNPEKDALYLSVTHSQNDGATAYRLAVGEVPVDGFWSVTVYNVQGYFTANERNAHSLNNITAEKSLDGTTGMQFRRLPGRHHQLPTHHTGLELHGPPLPAPATDR